MGGSKHDVEVLVVPDGKSASVEATTSHRTLDTTSSLDDAIEDSRQDERVPAISEEVSNIVARHVVDDDCIRIDPLEQSLLHSVRSSRCHRAYLDELKSVQARRMFDDSVVICQRQQDSECPRMPAPEESSEMATAVGCDRVNILHRSFAWSQDSQEHNEQRRMNQILEAKRTDRYHRADSLINDGSFRDAVSAVSESPTSTWVYWEEKIMSTAALMTDHSSIED